jgi:hypothetical protein
VNGSPAVVPPSDDAGLKVVLRMIDAVELVPLAELERALRLRLHPPAPLGPQRLAELGFLAELIERDGTGDLHPETWPGVPVVPRHRYDELAPEHAWSSQRLVERYAGWLGVCRAAYRLRPDGRTSAGPGQPWAMRHAVRDGRFRWDRERCLEWPRRCAGELGRPPSPQRTPTGAAR